MTPIWIIFTIFIVLSFCLCVVVGFYIFILAPLRDQLIEQCETINKILHKRFQSFCAHDGNLVITSAITDNKTKLIQYFNHCEKCGLKWTDFKIEVKKAAILTLIKKEPL